MRSLEETREFLIRSADRMRLSPTPMEAVLLAVLGPQGFEAQYPVQGATKNEGAWAYVLDLYHPGAKLCIEIDGRQHYKKHGKHDVRLRGRDRRRDTRLAQLGILTVRVTNRDVRDGLHQVTEHIERLLAERLTGEETCASM